MSEALHVKYRPKSLKDVVGQKAVVNSIEEVLAGKSRPHAFLFTGPSGCGKTTLARILANEFECSPENIMEVDAATNTGIDAMRAVTTNLIYTGFGDTPNKMIIIDECHALSKAAWQSMLKAIEEPAAHVFFALCTTDPGKVPSTIVTRCLAYNLKPVKFDDLMDLLEMVADEEGLKTPAPILQLVARSADGSPRQALTQLAKVASCTDEDEAAYLLEAALETKEVIDLCRKLLDQDLSWKEAMDILSSIPEQNPESIRIVVTNYVASCLAKPRDMKKVPYLLDVLAAFSKPCNPTDKMAPILLALGNVIYP